MTRARVDKTHPKSFTAIDEVAPRQGEQVYWRAFERFEEYIARRTGKRRRENCDGSCCARRKWTVEEPPP